MRYYLGIDGGGSTIRAALTDHDRKVVAHFKLNRNSNPTSTGFEYLRETLEMIRERIADYVANLKIIIINLAGVGATQQLKKTKQTLEGIFPEAERIEVFHDAHGSLLANSPGEASILVICGTGSAIVGKDHNENFYRAGGWGYLLGDEASGFWLVKSIFQEYLAYHDGVREDDRAFDVFRERFETEPRDALYRFYEADHRRETASLSSVFLENHYPLAQEIAGKGIMNIKNRIEVLKDKLNDSVKSIIFMGGMFESAFFQEEFKDIIGDAIPVKKGKNNIEIELANIGKEKDGRDHS